MKFQTYEESRTWLEKQGARIDGNRNVWFGENRPRIMATAPTRISALKHFSSRVIAWVSSQTARMFWVSNWETEPPEPLVLFEKVREGCGERRPLIEAPGHVFEDSNLQDDEILTGLSLLVLAFGWEGYLVSERQSQFVFFGDEHIVFSSVAGNEMDEVPDLLKSFDLRIIQNVEEAWRSSAGS
jgi:hypothetical protein